VIIGLQRIQLSFAYHYEMYIYVCVHLYKNGCLCIYAQGTYQEAIEQHIINLVRPENRRA